MAPQTRYVDGAQGAIAYQEFGEGPQTLLYVPEIPSHLDLVWIDQGFSAVLERLASFARVVMFDRPGLGLSDPVTRVPTLEEQADDIAAVLDDTGTERAVVFSHGGSAPGVLYFAAQRPERVAGLVLWAPYAVGWQSSGWDALSQQIGPAAEAALVRWAPVFERWGDGLSLQMMAPGLSSDRMRRSWGLLERAAAGRAMSTALYGAATECDVSDVLGLIRTQTVILHSPDSYLPEAIPRGVADQIPNAVFHVLPTSEGVGDIAGLMRPIVDHIHAAVTGRPAMPEADRVLATVLFTDVVGSTEFALRVGDAEWKRLLLDHYALLRDAIDRHGGRLVDTAGDGSLSVFPGPAAAIRCAREIVDRAAASGLQIRSGVHTGECERVGENLGGVAVHIGARVSAVASAGEVLVSRTVRDLVTGSGIDLESRGEHELKGIPGLWELFLVTQRGGQPVLVDTASDPQTTTAADRAVLFAARRAPRLTRLAGRIPRLRA